MVPPQKRITRHSELARNLARGATKIKNQVKIALQSKTRNTLLQNLFIRFSILIPDLDIEAFADLFAQLISHTLFCVKAVQQRGFSIKNLMKLNPVMRILFEEFLQSEEADKFGIPELNNLILAHDNEPIFKEFQQHESGADPIVYFYELFLKEYDHDQKILRGVFYTPTPIVSFITRSVDHLLRAEFNCADGLLPSFTPSHTNIPEIQILDPSTGTGTFLLQVIDEVKRNFDKKYQALAPMDRKRKWNELVGDYLLPRLFGFELLMPPYIVAHLKLLLKLAETGYDFKPNEQLQLYLTNTLEGISNTGLYQLKMNDAITITIGNPPYQVNSKNTTPYIENLMQIYKVDVKDEKYIKPLSDDYIKFIRLAHHLIDATGSGILGMVTNHGFLSGLIHRGMRKQLLQSFDKLYILDLHGNSNIGETCPDGSEDENVFDIQQGVVIILFVKLPSKLPEPEVYHLDLWGTRDNKYEILSNNNVSTISWRPLHPIPPNYFFFPYETALVEEYQSYLSLKDIFKLQRIGILTNRDWLVVDFSRKELEHKMEQFFKLLDKPELQNTFPQLIDTWWDYRKLSEMKVQTAIHSITKCLFRPFDVRYITYHPLLLNRARTEVMDHINGKDNLVLIASRHHRKKSFNSCFISEYVVEQKAGESTRGSYVFPLYFYSNKIKYSNFTSSIKERIEKLLPEFDDIAIFSYIYSILHSNGYRTRYEAFLKLDFPRIPFTTNHFLFTKLVDFGRELISLHLLKQKSPPNVSFEGLGDNIIKIGYPQFKDSSIYINASQQFKGVPKKTWSFIIGGYPVCQKWLKDRKGRSLKEYEILHYRKIIGAITRTIQIMNEIDNTIENYGGWPF
ncbi:MAG: N-6 DNA methylase [Candidatus Helarchaeota archaeon]|nr:N-6 DNA methylase [Candidatus Helarchaeota archaeon]